MSVSTVGRRYASALFNVAKEQNKLEAVNTGLSDFAKAFAESEDLQNVFENPSIGAQTRRAILDDVAEASQLPEILTNTLRILADRGRMAHIGEIAEAFEGLVEQATGRLQAEVTTAADLPEAYFTELEKTLEQVTGKQVTLVRKTDPSLLGGVVTRIGDQVFDGSIKHRLAGLKEELLN